MVLKFVVSPDDRIRPLPLSPEEVAQRGVRHLSGQHDQKTRGKGTIHSSEVKAYLKGSAITTPTYHQTTTDNLQSILDNGVDVTRGKGLFGQGFYTAQRPEKAYGGTPVKVAVRMEKPLDLRKSEHEFVFRDLDTKAWKTAQATGKKSDADVGAILRKSILDRGYDGVIVKLDNSPMWAIAMKPGSVRVVVD